MARGGDPPRIHDRRSRARSASPPPADGGDGAIWRAVRSSAAEVAASSARGCSVPPGRVDEGSRLQLESLLVPSEQPQGKMVHPQLGLLLSRAMARMNKEAFIDGKSLDELISELRSKIQSTVNLTTSGSKSAIKQAVIKQLCRLIDSEKKPSFVPKKGNPCVVLVIGLQGSGKTTSCAKYAYHHQRKGHRPALVSADTRGQQAFKQLQHIAHDARIPVYGSYNKSDPLKAVVQGVEKFTKENSDLIIIDANGSHMSDDSFLTEICKIYEATKPELTILVMDAGCGRFASDQAQMFRRKISVGSVILTRMDIHSNGAGALNALAAARLPVIMLGTGKQIQEFEIFDVKLFTKNLLDHKSRSIPIDTEAMHKIFDNLKLSDTQRKSAIDEVEEECRNAYNSVLEKHKLLAQQICCLDVNYKGLCDILGEKNLKDADIQSATTLEERHSLMSISIRSLEEEKISRTRKLGILLPKVLALCDSLGATSNEQRKYKHMLENFSVSIQEVNSLSTESLKKLETRVQELEVKKAECPYRLKDYILRQGQLYIKGETKDRGGLKDLIKMTAAWESMHREAILYEKKGLLIKLKKIEENEILSLINSDSSQVDSHKSDTEMARSTSSSRSDTEMVHSSTSSGTSRSDSNDPDYSPDSTESDISMGRMVVSESSDSM